MRVKSFLISIVSDLSRKISIEKSIFQRIQKAKFSLLILTFTKTLNRFSIIRRAVQEVIQSFVRAGVEIRSETNMNQEKKWRMKAVKNFSQRKMVRQNNKNNEIAGFDVQLTQELRDDLLWFIKNTMTSAVFSLVRNHFWKPENLHLTDLEKLIFRRSPLLFWQWLLKGHPGKTMARANFFPKSTKQRITKEIQVWKTLSFLKKTRLSKILQFFFQQSVTFQSSKTNHDQGVITKRQLWETLVESTLSFSASLFYI